jgi:predicted tellurium resistance membrane protein TerC
MPKKSSKRRSTKRRQGRGGTLIFERRNYVLMAVGVLLVAVGFAIMRIENEFQGFISLYVAPLLILGGYAEVIYAILWRPSDEDAAEADG